MTITHLYFLGLVLGSAIPFLRARVLPNDLWWHMASGRFIVSHHTLPIVDEHSITHLGARFVDQEWLGGLLLFLQYRLGGLAAVTAFEAVIVGLSVGLLLWTAQRRCRSLRLSALATGVGFVTLAPEISTRPQTFAVPIFITYLFLLGPYLAHQVGERKALVWPLPLLMGLWVNLHGSFVLGLGILAAATIAVLVDQGWRSSHFRRLVACLVATLAATLVNPEGLGIWRYVMHVSSSPAVRDYVLEWRQPTAGTLAGAIFFVPLAVVVVVSVLAPDRPALGESLVLAVLVLLSLLAIRNVLWFGAALAPFLAGRLKSLLPAAAVVPEEGRPVLNRVIAVALVGMTVVSSPWVADATASARATTGTPLAFATFIRQHPADLRSRVFSTDGAASYLAYAVPEIHTLLDTRAELYSVTEVRDYQAVMAGTSVARVLARYGLSGVLVDGRQAPALRTSMSRMPGWRLVWQDSRFSYFVRAGT